jgi:two-component system OmpR family response regulator
VTKPFSPRELVARVKAILKRIAPVQTAEDGPLVWGKLLLDEARHLCRYADAEVNLTSSEFTLLSYLMAHPESVRARAQVVDAVYGHIVVSDRTIDSHIRNLRKKLADAGCHDGITTIHGVGVRMGACLT